MLLAHHMDNTDKAAYWEQMREAMDTDGDGKISRQEYIDFNKNNSMSMSAANNLKMELQNKGFENRSGCGGRRDGRGSGGGEPGAGRAGGRGGGRGGARAGCRVKLLHGWWQRHRSCQRRVTWRVVRNRENKHVETRSTRPPQFRAWKFICAFRHGRQ